MVKAHKYLVEIHTNHLDSDEIKINSEKVLSQQIKGEMIVVTGLDGINFEFFFSCLKAGGMEIGDIQGYIDSPQNLFNKEYLEQNIGKAIYIPSRYLSDLPGNYHFKVICIEQEISKTVEGKAFKLRKKLPENSVSYQMLDNIEKDKRNIDNWISDQPNQALFICNWEEILLNKKEQVDLLNEFVGNKIDVNKTISYIEEFI